MLFIVIGMFQLENKRNKGGSSQHAIASVQGLKVGQKRSNYIIHLEEWSECWSMANLKYATLVEKPIYFTLNCCDI